MKFYIRVQETIDKVKERVISGEHVVDACRNLGLGRTTFYNRKCIAELKQTCPKTLQELLLIEKRVAELNKLCKQKLEESPLKRVRSEMKRGSYFRFSVLCLSLNNI